MKYAVILAFVSILSAISGAQIVLHDFQKGYDVIVIARKDGAYLQYEPKPNTVRIGNKRIARK